MISAIAWIPPGASAQTPKFADIPESELKETRERMKRRTDVEDESEDDESEGDEVNIDEDSDDDEEDMADKHEMKDALNDVDESDDDSESEDEKKRVKKSEKRKAIQKAQAVANAARGITDDLAELDMDNYDNDESYDEDIQERQLFGKMNSEFE